MSEVEILSVIAKTRLTAYIRLALIFLIVTFGVIGFGIYVLRATGLVAKPTPLDWTASVWEVVLGPLGVVPAPPTTPTPAPEENLVEVNRPIQFTIIDKFAGGALASRSITIYKGTTQVEGPLTTDSNGQKTTSLSYRSGEVLNVLVNDSSAYQWFVVTVPKMNEKDAEAISTNPITLYFWQLQSWSLNFRDGSGNTYTNNANFTVSSSNATQTVTITIYGANDNKGYVSSEDPIDNVKWNAYLVILVNGTGYENVIISGMDGQIEKGSKMYFWKRLPDDGLTKYKKGTTYILPGSTSVTLTLDLTGYTGSSADLVCYLYIYADADYFQAKGSWGPDAVSKASLLLNLKKV